jgi:endonuclease YncB( thermonuclease family)
MLARTLPALCVSGRAAVAKTWGPYKGRVVRVHDGDTVMIDLDLGFDHLIVAESWDGTDRLACRVYGINAPELRTAAGQKATEFAKTLLKPGDIVQVLSYGWDKWGGRFDGTITLADGRDFAQTMLDAKQARPYLPKLAGNVEDSSD